MNKYDSSSFPAKNKIQTENKVLDIVNNGKASLTKDDWYSVIYAAYQINALQDIIATGYKGNPITDIDVETIAGTPGQDSRFIFTFTFRMLDDQGNPTGDPKTIVKEVSVPSVVTSVGQTGPIGPAGPAGKSLKFLYSATDKPASFEETHEQWKQGDNYLGLALTAGKPLTIKDYKWAQFIGKELINITVKGLNLILTWRGAGNVETTTEVPLDTHHCLPVSHSPLKFKLYRHNVQLTASVNTGYEGGNTAHPTSDSITISVSVINGTSTPYSAYNVANLINDIKGQYGNFELPCQFSTGRNDPDLRKYHFDSWVAVSYNNKAYFKINYLTNNFKRAEHTMSDNDVFVSDNVILINITNEEIHK